jgi:hypothetical protein
MALLEKGPAREPVFIKCSIQALLAISRDAYLAGIDRNADR